jgi:hypothetical protein
MPNAAAAAASIQNLAVEGILARYGVNTYDSNSSSSRHVSQQLMREVELQ